MTYTAVMGLLGGILLLAARPDLPDTLFVEFLPILVFFALFGYGKNSAGLAPAHATGLLVWFGIGFLWALFRAGVDLGNVLPMGLEDRDMVIEGIVASLPAKAGRRTRFALDVDKVVEPATQWGDGQRIRLNWYKNAPELLPGEKWRLKARLKRPRGFRNPGGFDYEKWLFQAGIRATGYVRWGKENQKLAGNAQGYPEPVRYRLARMIGKTLDGSPHAGIVQALSIGIRDGITAEQWTTLRETGTAHLMAISGLHIGFVALLIFFAARRLWTIFPSLALLVPAQRLAAPIAVASALGYAALAGFSLPTQRALVMACVVMAGLFWRRHTSPAFSLATALFAVLLLDPFSVLSLGFWLSFTAVAVILFGMTGRRVSPMGTEWWRGLWWKWGRAQVLILVGLMPLTVLFFHQQSLISPLANLLAIPWIGFAALPLVLAGTCLMPLLPDLGGLLLGAGEWTISVLWPWIEWLASLDLVYRKPFAPPFWTIPAAGVGAFLLLLPKGMPGRWLGIIWFLPLFLISPPRPMAGEAWFTLLDVGQGLAAVVSTREHVLVYDTGPQYGPGFHAGGAVIAPFLRNQGIASVDRVVISHRDADHSGGLAGLLEEVPAAEIFIGGVAVEGKDSKKLRGSSPCHDGMAWRWDGVHFRFLHPPSDEEASGSATSENNASCVLAITNAAGTILLTGDIEHAAERRLVETHGDGLRAHVLVAPHHGSDSGSGAAFLAATRPRHALFSVGYRNRFHLPSASVIARYEQTGARLSFSDRHGAIGFRLAPGAGLIGPVLHGREMRRFWHAE